MLSAARGGCQLVARGAGNAKRERRLPAPLACMRVLRQVVTDRRKHHVVQPVRTNTIASGVHAGPGVALHVGVLTAELEPALRTIVKAVPETNGALKDGAGIAVAIGQRIRNGTIGTQYGGSVDGSCGRGERERLNSATVVAT